MHRLICLMFIFIVCSCLLSGCAGAGGQLKDMAIETSWEAPEQILPNFEYRLGDFDVLEIEVWEGVSKSQRRRDKEMLEHDEYFISRGDTLDIYVWRWDDLTRDVIVRPDGRISYPLVGDIIAEGLTLIELDEIITELLKEFIRSPEVSVMVKDFGERGSCRLKRRAARPAVEPYLHGCVGDGKR